MNVLVAKNSAECSVWTGTAVVIDVLRSATTVCALLGKGANRDVVICPDEATTAQLVKEHPGFAVISGYEMALPHQDNSPYLAEKLSSRQSVFLMSQEVGQALLSLRRASSVFIGGFCNFRALVQAVRHIGQDVLLVPTTFFSGRQDEEDMLCVQAFKEFVEHISTPEPFVEAFQTTVRLVEVLQSGSPTAQQDLTMALTLDGFSVVPQVAFAPQGNWAACFVQGKQPNPAWGTVKPVAMPAPEPSPFSTTLDLKLRPMVEKTLLASQLMPQPAVIPTPVENQPAQPEKFSPTQQKTISMVPLGGEADEPTPSVTPQDTALKQPNKPSRLRGFFAGIVKSVKEEASELGKTFRHEKKENLQRRELPSVSLSTPDAAEPPVEKNPSPEPTARPKPARSGVVLSEDKTVAGLSLPREGLHVNVSANTEKTDTPSFQAEDFLHENPPITEEPRANTPRERVLELSIFDQEPVEKPQKPAEPVAPAPHKPSAKKAVVLFSGGLDSTTCLYWALAQGYTCEALTVSYGQRHLREVVSAQAICKQLGVKHHVIELNLPWLSASSLVNTQQPLPDTPVEQITRGGVPSTYVPGRNLMFLSIAGSLLDAVGATAIVAGPNAVDFSGYPDCTPAFFKAAGEALNRGTQRGVREGIEVLAPLMTLSKAEIVKLAVQLNVPLKLTWSCYAGGEKPCGKCDSCKLRAKGFAEAGYKDPAL